ncbi:zinc-binding dehydrogenase [Actinomadura sp. 9N215]|uniref:zinc-binding dehydrogenase n=1 Tax=Actinomadura sp. 9N215 TaxID=3375150 RepID=UPI0037B5EF28
MPGRSREVQLAVQPDGLPKPEHFAVVEAPMPVPGDGEVLVRNRFFHVSPALRTLIGGSVKGAPFPRLRPGDTLYGKAIAEVMSAPPDAGVQPGDLVQPWLGWREYAAVPAGQWSPLDDALPDPAAHLGQAAIAYTALTRDARLRPGDTVFVSGGAGGIGSLAGQIARALGAGRVIGSTGSPDKAKRLVTELGYDAAVLRRTPALGTTDAHPETNAHDETNPLAATDARPVTDALAATDTQHEPDALAATDTQHEPDALAATDTQHEPDALAATDAHAGTDALAATDTHRGTGALAGADAHREAVVPGGTDPFVDQLAKAAPDGIDVLVDNVGGEQLQAAIAVARPGARFAIVGTLAGQLSPDLAGATAPVEIDTFQLIVKGIEIRGFGSSAEDAAGPEWTERFGGWLRSGEITFPHVRVAGIENAPRALHEMIGGRHLGTVIVEL